MGGGRSTRRMAGAKDAEWRPFNARPWPGRSPPGNRRAARCPAEFRRMSCGAGRALDRRADPAAAGTPAAACNGCRSAACLHAGAMAPAGMVPAGMVPPMGGTISCRRWPAGTVLPIGSTRGRPAIAGRQGGGGRGKAPMGPCGDAGASLGLVQSIDCTVPGLPENADFAGFQRGDLGKCLYVQSGLCVVGAMRHGALGDGSQCPPPFRPCPLIPRLLVRKLGFWRPAPPAPRVPCPGPRCPGTVQEPRASSRHGRPRNGLGHAPTRKSAEPAASVACLQ